MLLAGLAFGLPALAAAGPVEVGVITSLSGRFATFGAIERAGYEVAMEEVNAAGGVLGRPLALAIEDDSSNQNAALSAAERLASRGVPVITGAYASPITKPLAAYMPRLRVPLVIPNSWAEEITNPGSEWVFRPANLARTISVVLLDMADRLGGMKSIAILSGSGAFELSVADAAERIGKERGYQIVDRQNYDVGLTDFRPILNRFRTRNPDIVFLVSYEADAVAIMRQAKEVNLNPKMFAGGAAGFALSTFVKGAGDTAEYMFVATRWPTDLKNPKSKELYEKLKAKLGDVEPTYHAIGTYLALLVAADAINRAGSTDPAAVRRALEQTRLQTFLGTVQFRNFDGFRNQAELPMYVQQVQDGRHVTVFPDSAAVAAPRFPTPPWNQR